MTRDEMIQLHRKAADLTTKRGALLEKLIEPTRAAANQMKDAGMHRGADAVFAVLFELDATNSELDALLKSITPAEIADFLMTHWERRR